MTKENSAGLATLLHDGEAKWLAETMVRGIDRTTHELVSKTEYWSGSRRTKRARRRGQPTASTPPSTLAVWSRASS
jgi:hypothetical protein